MNFLFIQAKGAYIDIPWALTELSHNVSFYPQRNFDPLVLDDSRYEEVGAYLDEHTFDYVITYMFFPAISDLCYERRLVYISWTYDSPLVSLFSDSLFHETNYTFLFDKAQCQYFTRLGAPHVYYLPMAVNTNRIGALNITPEEESEYACDISFIGNMYDRNTYNESVALLPDRYQLELKSYLVHNLCTWHEKKVWPQLSDELTEYFLTQLGASRWPHFNMPDNLFLGILLLSRKLGEMDRLTVLNTLNAIHPVDLYTASKNPMLQGLRTHPPVSYSEVMNKIFYLSRINLNITLPSIESGLPQRIFDIMGCGGFVLTNYQEDLDELFDIGKEIEVFHDLDELKEKTAYYLSHEKERLSIAIAGYQKIMHFHTYTHRMNQLIEIVERNPL